VPDGQGTGEQRTCLFLSHTYTPTQDKPSNLWSARYTAIGDPDKMLIEVSPRVRPCADLEDPNSDYCLVKNLEGVKIYIDSIYRDTLRALKVGYRYIYLSPPTTRPTTRPTRDYAPFGGS